MEKTLSVPYGLVTNLGAARCLPKKKRPGRTWRRTPRPADFPTARNAERSGTLWSMRRIAFGASARQTQANLKTAEHFPERDYDLECHENLNQAKYELHLFNAQGEKR